MRHKKQRNIKLGFLVLVVIIGISFLAYEELNGNPNLGIGRADTFSFQVPLPDELRFTGGTSSNEVTDITCNLKHVASSIDTRGVVLQNLQSSLLSGNPLLDITDSNYNSLAGYVVTMKAWCGAGSGQPALNLESSQLSLIVQSEKPDGGYIQTVSKSMNTKTTNFKSGDGEKDIGYFSLYGYEIEDRLPSTPADYSSRQKFEVVGNMNVSWEGYSNIKYKIPIGVNQLVAWHYAKIVNEEEALNPDLADTDGDGIINLYEADGCENQPETYNGYKDGDGCPDTVPLPDSSDDPTPAEAVTQTSCNADGKTWYMYSTSDSTLCGTAYKLTDGSTCDVYNNEDKFCVGEEVDNTTTTTEVKGTIKWQVDVTKTDGGSFAFQTSDDKSPFEFLVPLDVTGSDLGGSISSISKIVFTPTFLMTDPELHKNTTVQDIQLELRALAGICEGSYNPSTKLCSDGSPPNNNSWTPIKTQTFSSLTKTSGSGHPTGIELPTFTVTAQDIESGVSATTVPLGETKTLVLSVFAFGTANNSYLDVTINTPATLNKEYRIAIPSSTTDNKLSFTWYNMQLNRGGDDVEKTFPKTKAECDELAKSHTGVTWLADKNECVVVDILPNLTQGDCLARGGTWSNNQCQTVKTEPTPNGGMCKLDTAFPSDSNNDGAICGFCIDSDTTNNFPCDQPYRDNYCGGSVASPAECGDIPKQCDDLFADKSNGCVVDTGESCPDGFVSLVKGLKVQCNPSFTPDTPDGGETCPAGAGLLSLADNACVIVTGTPKITTGGTSTCANVNGVAVSCSPEEDSTFLMIGILVAGVGVGAVIIKKRR